nr:uncharacterized protein LOC111429193 [Onthophagus taurus]
MENESDDIINNDSVHENETEIVDGPPSSIKEEDKESIEQTQDIDVNTIVQATTEPQIEMFHEDAKNFLINFLIEKDYKDIKLELEPGSNLGDNFMGFIGKLTITAVDQSDQNKTFNWIVKTAPSIEHYRTALNIEKCYRRESYIYSEVFRIFDQFQLEKQVLNPFCDHPKFVLSYLENCHETIVMENIKNDGYVMRPRQEPLDLNHVKLVMKAYGKLHALSFALKDQKPDVFKRFVENTPDIVQHSIVNGLAKEMQKLGLQLSLGVLDPVKEAKILNVYKKFVDNYLDVVIKLLQDTNERAVIGHGDCWVNNMLWKYELSNQNIPTKVCLLDWQLSRYGSLACDLSYFFFTATTKEFRDQHYDNMIKLYYYTLCGQLNELGSDPQKLLSFDELQEELEKYSLVGINMAIPLLGVITRDSGDIPEWRSDDVNPEEVQQQWAVVGKNADVYAQRVRGVIIDAYEKGYFKILNKFI